MAQTRALKILLVCPWVMRLTGMQASLRAQGLSPEIVRVDFPAAMRAALVFHRFEAAFYIDTPSLPHDTAHACIREHAPKLVLTIVDRLEQIGPELAKLLASRRS